MCICSFEIAQKSLLRKNVQSHSMEYWWKPILFMLIHAKNFEKNNIHFFPFALIMRSFFQITNHLFSILHNLFVQKLLESFSWMFKSFLKYILVLLWIPDYFFNYFKLYLVKIHSEPESVLNVELRRTSKPQNERGLLKNLLDSFLRLLSMKIWQKFE
jgi:hypothetical protein